MPLGLSDGPLKGTLAYLLLFRKRSINLEGLLLDRVLPAAAALAPALVVSSLKFLRRALKPKAGRSPARMKKLYALVNWASMARFLSGRDRGTRSGRLALLGEVTAVNVQGNDPATGSPRTRIRSAPISIFRSTPSRSAASRRLRPSISSP